MNPMKSTRDLKKTLAYLCSIAAGARRRVWRRGGRYRLWLYGTGLGLKALWLGRDRAPWIGAHAAGAGASIGAVAIGTGCQVGAAATTRDY